MSAVLFAPHADDESLFAFYAMMREDARVHVLLHSGSIRRGEFTAAMATCGRTWTYSHIPEDDPDWEMIAVLIADAAAAADVVIAPAFEQGGHEHHNQVAQIVAACEHPNVISYLTYRRGHGRSEGVETTPLSPEMRDMKLAALQCYRSQWEDPKTAPWFPGGEYGTYREWVA